MQPMIDPAVAAVFDRYPALIRSRLLELRELIFATASELDGVGEIQETLKWGQPAYLTTRSRSGSTIRIDRNSDSDIALYFHCRTSLIDTFSGLFPELRLEGNRAVLLPADGDIPMETVRRCIAMALTYHRDKRDASSRQRRDA